MVFHQQTTASEAGGKVMMELSIDARVDYVAQFSSETKLEIPTITAARANALLVQDKLRKALHGEGGDADVVAFGSLARLEWTSGSDIDWTLLVDGIADAEHRASSRRIAGSIAKSGYPPPGSEGIFGNMAFSHELVHHIGGQADSNRNTTQRILLLLEAVPLTTNLDDIGAYERTVRQILRRYLLSDSNFHSASDSNSRIPRFLLNDIVRYWRTMCVDFAYKDWEQAGKKWAIRNIKLRTSRKLLFVAGLMMVFSCYKNRLLSRMQDEDAVDYFFRLQDHLSDFVHSTPMNVLVCTLNSIKLDVECKEFLLLYEQFLFELDDAKVRKHLDELKEEDVYQDPIFLRCRALSHKIQTVLRRVFFETESPLREFTFEYGVF